MRWKIYKKKGDFKITNFGINRIMTTSLNEEQVCNPLKLHKMIQPVKIPRNLPKVMVINLCGKGKKEKFV
jgi:hypothetical protein